MAIVKINPVKQNTHLTVLIDYIGRADKTNESLKDCFRCSWQFAEKEFENIRRNAVSRKGNNIAWHIKQAFSPEDNITPEKALEIGKELMQKMYPNYPYLIATHTDRAHIHNHIVLNSVNFEDYHKLNSNKTSLAQLQNISDDLCRENDLSVISRNSKNQKMKLRENIDEAITSSNSFSDFITAMQDKGYSVKLSDKYISFKDESMERYIRSSSISRDYTLPFLKNRLLTKAEAKYNERVVYDDKLSYRSLRKVLRLEINDSIRKAHTYEEFLEDMEKKNFEVKQGKHLAFKGELQERFLRSDSISYSYSEEAIRYKIEHKDEYRTIKKVKTIPEGCDWALENWIVGENSNIKNTVRMFVGKRIGGFYSNQTMYLKFMEIYNQKIAEVQELYDEAKELDSKIKELKVALRTESQISGRNSSAAENLRNEVYKLEEQKKALDLDRVKLDLEMQDYNTVKYNYESKDGHNYNYEKMLEQQQKENNKSIIKKILNGIINH